MDDVFNGLPWDNPQTFNNINDGIKEDTQISITEINDSRANSLYFGWTNVIKRNSY